MARTPGLKGFTADTLTLMTLVLTVGVLLLLVQGAIVWAGLLFLLASAFAMLDGALARAKQATSRFGAFLDSTVDRYSELLVILGLLISLWLLAMPANLSALQRCVSIRHQRRRKGGEPQNLAAVKQSSPGSNPG